MKRLRFRPSMRLRQPAQFDRVFAAQQKRGDRHLLVFAAANDLEISRCGVVVSKRQGNAVKRTRLKRLLREAFRLSQSDLPAGLDLVLIPRAGAGSGLDDYIASLRDLVGRIVRGIDAARVPPPDNS